MDERPSRNRIASGNPWSAGCSETGTSGAEGGPEKRTGRDPSTALRPDPYTHFTKAGVAATVVEDLVSRKWLAEIVSAEETSTQVQVVFTEALQREGLLARVTARHDGLVDPPPTTRPGRSCWP